MSDKKKNNELTEFMKSIPEDPMPEEMWDEEPAATIIYPASEWMFMMRGAMFWR